MANAPLQTVGISFRAVQVLALNALGVPAATGVTEYAGVRILGAKAMTINIPDWDIISGTGDDRVLASFLLPPQEAANGELRVGATDLTAEALLSGINIKSEGERKLLPFGHDLVELPEVTLLGWRAMKSGVAGDVGRAGYDYTVIPRATLFAKGGNYDERATTERGFGIALHKTSKYPWGEALVSGTDGHSEMEGAICTSEYVPRISAFKADGTELAFAFGVNAVATGKVKVYKVTSAGVWSDITAQVTLTIAVTGLTFSAGAAPANGDFIIVSMEVAV